MYSEKKITKEDTWRPDELMKHLQGQDKKSKRRERSEREEERGERRERSEREEAQRTRRSRESRERMQQELERDVRREGQRQRDSTRERTKESERDREEERRRKEKKEVERRKEREREQNRYGEQLGREERTDRDENYDREEKQIQRYKDREREENLGRHKDREREMERWHEKEWEKHRKDREKKRERDTEKDWEKERERRRGDRGKEPKTEKERTKEKESSRDVEDKKDKERERRERQRERGGEREHLQKQEEWKGERQEKPRHGQMSGSADEEGRREKKKREKEYRDVEAVENVRGSKRRLRQKHHGEGDEAGRERTSGREERDSKNSRDERHQKYENSHGNREQEVEPEVLEMNDEALGFRNEDYEDDFEDFEEEEVDQDEGKEGEEDENGEREGRRELSPWRRDEIKAIQRAMEQENEMVSSAHSKPPTKLAEPPHTESRPVKVQTHSRVIDFTAARQREARLHTAHRQQERRAELLRLIDLDFSATESLLDLPPVSEYDMYIKSFGMSNTKQVYVQCNEDNIDRHTQTEEPDTCEKWTQHPAMTSAVCGGPKVSQNAPEAVSWMNIDSKRLATFLHSASQVMTVLLEESRRDCDSVKGLHSHTHPLPCSDRNLQLNTKLPFLHGRQVTLLHAQVHSLLSVHAPVSSLSDNTLHIHTLLCVWSIWEPSAPQRILACEAEVQACCFSPGRASLVFAGTDVGSVLLWDLRERSSSHQRLLVDAEELTLRYPTFSTDAVLSGAGHFSSVVSVEPALVTVEVELRQPLLTDQEESLGLSFQLGSLDENGHLILWVVVELPKADDSGSQADLGLRPGGRVKLLHSSSLQTCDRSTSRGPAEVAEVTEVTGFMPHPSLLLKFLPSDSNHYFIGTNTGQVRRGTRHGLRVYPNLYTPAEGVRRASVTALDFCTEPFFLVGCSDGTVRLHSLAWAEPVCEWHVCSDIVPVQSVYWCPTRPTVFCALDATSVLHVWDLTEREDWPISSQNLQPDRVTSMAVFGEVANQSLSSGFALARQSGRLEIHFLKQSLTLLRASDPETLRSLEHNTL